MESSGTGIGRLDCYEDMFKEITRKLYGDDPDHRTSNVQNEFETVYKTEVEDTGNGTDVSEDEKWTLDEEPLKGTDGSRVAAYQAATSTWRCYECGDCMGGAPRDMAEHFVDMHSSRGLIEETNRVQRISGRKDYLSAANELRLEDVVSYLERLRDRAERGAPPSRRTQETQTVPATLLPVTSSFLLQELPTALPQHLHQIVMRDFQGNRCRSSASLAELVYEGNKVTILKFMTAQAQIIHMHTLRNEGGRSSGGGGRSSHGGNGATGKRYTCVYCPYGTDRRDLYTRHENIHREEKPFHCYVCFKPFSRADHVKKHFLRMHREHTYELSRIRRPPGSVQTPVIKSQQIKQENKSSSSSSTSSSSKGNQEKRYTCCYCSWSGVDNWCLKRHLNTHLKPFACALCEYKAARAERLATHVLKVHNRRQCSRCSYLAEDLAQLQMHQLQVHRVSSSHPIATSSSTSATSQQIQQQQQQQQTSVVQQTSQAENEPQQQTMTVLAVGGGRAPPGPPVFPASSAAIAPATTVIPPTTILGVASTPGIGYTWIDHQQHYESSSCEERFERRSRKQRTPRKISYVSETPVDEQPINCVTSSVCPSKTDQVSVTESTKEADRRSSEKFSRYKCLLCPKYGSARLKRYHSKASLLLHKLWKHPRDMIRRQRERHRRVIAQLVKEEPQEIPKTEITLKATVRFTRSSAAAAAAYQR
ncbi:hypothetical protein QAD02_001730 [Eretmocerus hayati]|uniref:Uncharacterized protein n=1 Tax=Eretmocerus hayati TaxID=131215 RepID=A0ACC2NHS6_9HYME|nr:hypothetical protein QAD02_001730 [Eretmocerus hayati]